MLLLVAAIVLLITLLYIKTLKPKDFPPGPPRIPFVGYGLFLDKHLVHKALWRLSDTYGPVIGIYLGPVRTVVVNGWDSIKESLTNDDLNGRHKSVLIPTDDSGNPGGIMFTEGELWKEQRRFSLHHFRNLGFGKRSHEAVIHEETSELIKEMQEDNGGIEIQIKLGVSTTNILWAMMGGTRFQHGDQELISLVRMLNSVFRNGEISGTIVAILPILRHVLPKTSKFWTLVNGFQQVSKFLKTAVEDHKATLDKDHPRDFIDIYLIEMFKNNKNLEETTFTEQQLIRICVDVFTAGTETGSSTLAFAILLTTLHPEVMRKLHEEIDSVVGQKRLPSIDDRPNLMYTEAVITEVFRFRSAAPLTVPHCAMKDTTLQGYSVPARTVVFNNLYSIHMDKDYWGDPEQFRPERFINPDGTFRKDERVIPFGKGRRL